MRTLPCALTVLSLLFPLGCGPGTTAQTLRDGGGSDAAPLDGDDAGVLPNDDAGEALPDAGGTDAGGTDAGGTDAGSNDAGPSDAGAPPVEGPGAPGPFATATLDAVVMRGARETPVRAYVPSGHSDAPLVVFVPGFRLQAAWYAPLLMHLASHGFVVVGSDPDDPLFGIDHVEMALDVVAVVDWALADGSPLAGLVDGERVASSGHSLGGKVAVMAAARDERVDAVLALDPVNNNEPDVVADEVGALSQALGFLGETIDTEPAGFGGQACAPEGQNFAAFYAAATSSTAAYQWEIEGADHMDFVDDTSSCFLVCGVCQDGQSDGAVVRQKVRTLATAFLRRHLLAENALQPYLDGASVPTSVLTESKP